VSGGIVFPSEVVVLKAQGSGGGTRRNSNRVQSNWGQRVVFIDFEKYSVARPSGNSVPSTGMGVVVYGSQPIIRSSSVRDAGVGGGEGRVVRDVFVSEPAEQGECKSFQWHSQMSTVGLIKRGQGNGGTPQESRIAPHGRTPSPHRPPPKSPTNHHGGGSLGRKPVHALLHGLITPPPPLPPS